VLRKNRQLLGVEVLVKLPQALKRIWVQGVTALISPTSQALDSIIITLEHESSQYLHKYIRIAYQVLKLGEKIIVMSLFLHRHHRHRLRMYSILVHFLLPKVKV